jgi:hypothetical protein
MPIIPRTPIVPNRYAAFYSTKKLEPLSNNYDKFAELYSKSNSIVKVALVKQINNHVQNPIYEHLLNTMTHDNFDHIMGYLKSQNCEKMNYIIGTLVRLYSDRT